MIKHSAREIISGSMVLFVLVMVLGIGSCQRSAVESSTPTAVVEGFIEAQNAGDVEASLAFLADDAVIQFVPPPIPEDDGIFRGKEEIGGWYESTAQNEGQSAVSDVRVNGETVTALLTYSDNGLKQLGVDFIENEWTVTVKDGLIQGYQVMMTDASLEKLMGRPRS
jgi:hypothetical protein